MSRYTKKEFAAKENISVPILDSWIYRYGLPIVQIGRRVYITDEDFASWFASHRKVIEQKQPVRSEEIAIPRQCRKSSIAAKMRRIY